MKRICLFFLSLLIAGSVFSQQEDPQGKKAENPEFKTIFGKGSHSRIPIGYFIDLNAGYTIFNEKSVFLPGLSAGLILNHHWTIGLTGTFLGNPWNLYYNDIYFDSVNFSMHNAKLSGGFGGALLEYTLLPYAAVHVSFPLAIGFGYLQYTSDDYYAWNTNHHNFWNSHLVANSWILYLEPGLRAEFNLAKKLRLGVGISYRYSPKVDLPNTPTTLVNQFTARVNLRFGKF